jgi:hypothetical protein
MGHAASCRWWLHSVEGEQIRSVEAASTVVIEKIIGLYFGEIHNASVISLKVKSL